MKNQYRGGGGGDWLKGEAGTVCRFKWGVLAKSRGGRRGVFEGRLIPQCTLWLFHALE